MAPFWEWKISNLKPNLPFAAKYYVPKETAEESCLLPLVSLMIPPHVVLL